MSQPDVAPEVPAGGSARRSVRIALVALVAAAALAVVVTQRAASSDVERVGSPPRAATTPADGSSPSPTTPDLETAEAQGSSPATSADPRKVPDAVVAKDAVASVLALEAAALGAGKDRGKVPDPTSAAETSPYLESLRATALEFDAMGWTQTGAVKVEWVKALAGDEEADPPRVRVLACLDSSDVDVTDANGTSRRGEATPARSAQVFTLEQVDGAWQVVDSTFPDDPTC